MIVTPDLIRFGKRHDGRERVASSLKSFGWLPSVWKLRRSIRDNKIRSELRAVGVPLCASCGRVQAGADRLIPWRLLSPAAVQFAGYPCCCSYSDCVVTDCTSDITSYEVEIDSSGVVDDNCTDCEENNDIFILPYYTYQDNASECSHHWRGDSTTLGCGTAQLQINLIYNKTSEKWRIRYVGMYADVGSLSIGTTATSGQVPCADLTAGVALSLLFNTDNNCDWSGLSCTATWI